MYTVSLTFSKISIMLFYLRIFPDRKFRRWVFAGIAYVVCACISLGIPLLFQCKPVSLAWKGWDKEHSGKCVNSQAIVLVASGVNITLDIVTIGLPLRQISKLQLRNKDKIPLMMLFGVGFL